MLEPRHTRRLTEIAAPGDSKRGPSGLCSDDLWVSALELIKRSRSIAIVSGFYVMSANAPETDGPTGSVSLARSLLRLGYDVAVWVDSRCEGCFLSCAEVLGFPADRVIDVSRDMDGTEYPDALIYIERIGRASDGAYYDMRGNDISSVTSPLDGFALSGKSRVLGIGDGGNEVGMGNYRDELAAIMDGYERCLCSVGADICIPVDVSNWGAYALSAALSIDAGKWVTHSASEETAMLDALRSSGAVDGVTKKPGMSVDGFGLEKHLEICGELLELFNSA
ncbi:MAG: DUF4392 domain-containing protein [Synergistaceae bacterium]|jgi:hypothetical protein|nr:DUF4392 domain-containing protein [Synergistaceae bacterium]